MKSSTSNCTRAKKAIVLGGTEDHIHLIQLLRSHGYYTYLIDYYNDPPAKAVADEHIIESTLDLEKVLDISKIIKPNIVISACIDQALVTMAYVCEALFLPCHISYKTAIELTNKFHMKNIFLSNGIPSSRYVIFDTNNNCDCSGFKFPVVVKPVDSNSSKGISKVTNIDELDDKALYAKSFSRSQKVIVEEYVAGQEISADIMIIDKKPIILMLSKNIKSQKISDHFTIVQSLYQPSNDLFLKDKIATIAEKIASVYGINSGPLLIQLIYDGKEISVIEFSSRIGGGSKHHFIKKMTGFDLLDWYVNPHHCTTDSINISQNFNFGCINYVYAQNGTINKFVGFDDLKKLGVIEEFFFYKTVGMKINNHISSTDRPAGYMIVDNDLESFNLKTTTADATIQILDDDMNDLVIHSIYN